MEGHAKKCVEGYRELATEKVEHLDNVSTPCVDDHPFKEDDDFETVGGLSTVCSQIVVRRKFLASIRRPDLL